MVSLVLESHVCSVVALFRFLVYVVVRLGGEWFGEGVGCGVVGDVGVRVWWCIFGSVGVASMSCVLWCVERSCSLCVMPGFAGCKRDT